MSETVQALKDGVSWVCGMTLLSEDTEIRPASLSYVKPSEYRMSAENLIARLYDALETAQRERAEWEANAKRENALLVQAQQRIAELEQEREDVRRVEAWPASVREKFSITDETQNVCTHGIGYAETERKHYWNGYADAVDDAERAIRAALGRMLKEGE